MAQVEQRVWFIARCKLPNKELGVMLSLRDEGAVLISNEEAKACAAALLETVEDNGRD